MLPDSFKDSRVCVIGLGYVGLTLAVTLAEAGFRVHGLEISPKILSTLAQGRAHFSEYGLDDRLAIQVGKGRFTFSRTFEPDMAHDVFIVTVGTPVGSDKRTRFEALTQVTGDIAQVMGEGALVILRSTVRVGTTTEFVRPILERAGKGFDLAFCPERTLEGKALAELVTLPQIVGGINDHSTFRASQFFSFLTPTIIRVSGAEAAEMVKLVNNTQRDLMFAFANEIAAMADLLGLSAHEVIASGNIGYPRASMPIPGPVGGPCLEKDPYILAEGLEPYGFEPKIALTGRKWNEDLPKRTVLQLSQYFSRAGHSSPQRIAILGLAFKGRPETDDLRGTIAIPLIQELRLAFPDAELVGWDPMVATGAIAELGIQPARSAEDAAKNASIVILQNNHVALEQLKLPSLAHLMASPGMVYDFWNQHGQMDSFDLAPGIRYAVLGGFNLTR